jgi:hypothetical protein
MNSLFFFVVTLFTLHAYAQSSSELTCKSQAKEIAIQTYTNCMTEARNSQIDQIRKSYKEELASLKSKYDQELKQLGHAPTTTAKKFKRGGVTVQEARVSAPKATHGIARKLPTRTATTEALPVQGVTESAKVAPVEDSNSSLEKEAADADNNVEVIDMPVQEDASSL